MAPAKEAKVVIRLIAEDLFVAAGESYTVSWKIDQTNVWWFHAVPRLSQIAFPQKIQIESVRISATEFGKCYAYIKVKNLNAPKPPDYPWDDGCYFNVHIGVATAI
jgi:hypothetical protein